MLDYFYTQRPLSPTDSLKGKTARLPRQLGFALSKDLAVRVMGGYSLLVLAC